MISGTTIPFSTLSGFTAGRTTPKEYFSQIVGYIPTTLDTITTRLNEPLVQILARGSLIARFIFSLLRND